MGEFQDLKPLDGLEVSSISADLYNNGRDDLALFYFKEGANYALLNTSNSIVSETIKWNKKNLYYQVETLIFGEAINRALKPEQLIIGSFNNKIHKK